ncbi:hypothetical protein AOQ73_34230 [Bradyrhizobium pachyrhizi]|nr:hypothetical protein AOQ73_34230 [Bradyrhizobium pachyrhizi]
MERVTTDETTPELRDLLERELGIKVKATYNIEWISFCEKCDIRDFLDCITLANAFFVKRGQSAGARIWQQEVRRIFTEERLAYEIDEGCVVHPAVDKEFQRNRRSTLAGLQNARYSNSLAAFERISDQLAEQPPNGKDAWRAIFSAVEGLFRLMFPSAPQLNAGAAETYLSSIIQQTYVNDAVAMRAANKQLASFRDWIDSSHNYRHEQGSEEPVQPPIDLAVLAISNGTAFLRWLIYLDQVNSVKS